MGTTAQKLTYLNETKSQLKDTINYSGASITDDTFRQYPRKLYTQYLNILKDTSTLFNGMPKVPEQTGTELTINDTADTKIKLELSPSELTQETTTGANIQKYKVRTNPTFNYVCDDKGQVTITGNITGTANNLAYNYSSENPMNLTAGTYTLKVVGTISSLTGLNRNGINLTLNSNQECTFTLDNEVNGFIIQFNVSPGTHNDNFYVTLASGTTATTERYTGGMPQPNPDFPSEVQVIKGNNSIKIENKNLAWTGWAEDFVSRINNSSYAKIETYDNKNCLFFDRRAGYQEADTKYLFKTNWKENTQYTLNFDFKNTGSSTYANMDIVYTDDTVTEIIGTQINVWNNVVITSTANKTIKYIKTRWRSESTYIDLDTFMVLEGAYTSENIPSYVSHQEQVLPLNLPVENLIPTNSIYWEQGTISSADGNNSSSTTRIRTIDYYPIKEGNYYISIQDNNYCWLNLLYYNSNKQFITSQAYINTIDGLQNAQITVPNNTSFFRATIRNASGSTTIISNEINSVKPQIEKGTKANQYTPYGTTPIEYCKIGTYEDEFEHDGDKWYLNKVIKKLSLGELNWSTNSSGTSNWMYVANFINSGKYVTITSFSSHYKSTTITSSDTNQGYMLLNDNYIRIRFGNEDTPTNFKNWLTNNNVFLYYPLATPTHDEITDTTLISELNAIEQAVSYDEQTNISQANAGLPFRIKATAIKSLESVFN